jgi:hypothetical protein
MDGLVARISFSLTNATAVIVTAMEAQIVLDSAMPNYSSQHP